MLITNVPAFISAQLVHFCVYLAMTTTFISAKTFGTFFSTHVQIRNAMKQTITAAFIILLTSGFVACEKTNYEVVSTLNVRLSSTSAIDAEQLNIDIRQVQVNYGGTSWAVLSTPGQVYNLLDFQNGLDTLIAQGDIPATSIVKQLRLTLGPENSIKMQGKLFSFTTEGTPTELTFFLSKKLNRKDETITLNFDPALSISQSAQGTYQFNPAATAK